MAYKYWRKPDLQKINKTLAKYLEPYKTSEGEWHQYEIQTKYGRYQFSLDKSIELEMKTTLYSLHGRFDEINVLTAKTNSKYNHYFNNSYPPEYVITKIQAILKSLDWKGSPEC